MKSHNTILIKTKSNFVYIVGYHPPQFLCFTTFDTLVVRIREPQCYTPYQNITAHLARQERTFSTRLQILGMKFSLSSLLWSLSELHWQSPLSPVLVSRRTFLLSTKTRAGIPCPFSPRQITSPKLRAQDFGTKCKWLSNPLGDWSITSFAIPPKLYIRIQTGRSSLS
jgi:hypothetical protein